MKDKQKVYLSFKDCQELGDKYHYGIGVEKDETLAKKWRALASIAVKESNETSASIEEKTIETLAKQGDVKSQFSLADCYYEDNDFKSAFFWYFVASEQNHAEACYELARMYVRGEGVKIDYDKAWKLLNKAIELGSIQAKEFMAEIKIKKEEK